MFVKFLGPSLEMRDQDLQDLKDIRDWKHNGDAKDAYDEWATLTQRLDIEISVRYLVNGSSRVLF
jgi:hypothetical protein